MVTRIAINDKMVTLDICLCPNSASARTSRLRIKTPDIGATTTSHYAFLRDMRETDVPLQTHQLNEFRFGCNRFVKYGLICDIPIKNENNT